MLPIIILPGLTTAVTHEVDFKYRCFYRRIRPDVTIVLLVPSEAVRELCF